MKNFRVMVLLSLCNEKPPKIHKPPKASIKSGTTAGGSGAAKGSGFAMLESPIWSLLVTVDKRVTRSARSLRRNRFHGFLASFSIRPMPPLRYAPFSLLSLGPQDPGSDTTQLSNGRFLPARATNRKIEALASHAPFARIHMPAMRIVGGNVSSPTHTPTMPPLCDLFFNSVF